MFLQTPRNINHKFTALDRLYNMFTNTLLIPLTHKIRALKRWRKLTDTNFCYRETDDVMKLIMLQFPTKNEYLNKIRYTDL
jgi:hypothetical protein